MSRSRSPSDARTSRSVESREPLVEHARDFSDRRIGDLAAGFDEDRAHGAGRKRERDEQPLGREPDQLEPLEDAVVEPRAERDAELLGDDAETLRGAAKDRFDGRPAGRRSARVSWSRSVAAGGRTGISEST